MSILRIVLLLTTLLPPLWAQQYTFARFSVPGQSATQSTAINNRGAIVGYCKGKGFKRDANGVFEFPISGHLTGINDSGVIAGYYQAQGAYHSFLLTGGVNGQRTIIDVPPGPDTLISEINNLGDFTGRTEDINLGQSHSFVSIGGMITQIDVPGADQTRATGVAWDGTVVGYYQETVFGLTEWNGFVRGPKGNFLRFRVPFGTFTNPEAINNEAGVIVGTTFDTRNGVNRYHGFVYNYVADLAALNGVSSNTVRTVSAQSIDYPGRHDAYVTGVNAKGVLVGYTLQPFRPIFSFTATPLP